MNRKMRLIGLIILIWFNLESIDAQNIYSLTISDKDYFADTINYELVIGLPDGQYFIYRDNSKQVLHSGGEIINGVKSGTWQWFYESGDIMREIEYSEGLFNGDYVAYYPDGQRSLQIQYVNGVKNGLIQRWHKNGIKSFEGSFVKGIASGPTLFWSEEGTLIN